jgi:hypothetical protein
LRSKQIGTPALKVVETSPVAPPGRENLVRAVAARDETLAKYRAVSGSVDRLNELIARETEARAALQRALAQSAAGAAAGAIAFARGETAALEISSSDEAIDAARGEIAMTRQ